MNAPVLDEVAAGAPAGRRVAAGGAACLALDCCCWAGCSAGRSLAAVQTWNASTAYNHCFLIMPIVLYLLWDRRFDIAGIPPQPMPAAVLLGLPLALRLAGGGAAWHHGRAPACRGQLRRAAVPERPGQAPVVGDGRSVAVPLFPCAVRGVPDAQAAGHHHWFIRHGLDILGVPAFIDGYVIEIPQGTFFVAEACAGLRFLIASIAFGCLYALMMYRSPVRRGLFILVSIIVPVVANGFRGMGIVYLGYLLGSAEAAAADHLIYGWIFFSAVILILIALGLPFRQDDMSTRSAPWLGSIERPAAYSPRRDAGGARCRRSWLAAISSGDGGGAVAAAAKAKPTASAIDAGAGLRRCAGSAPIRLHQACGPSVWCAATL